MHLFLFLFNVFNILINVIKKTQNIFTVGAVFVGVVDKLCISSVVAVLQQV